MSEDPRAIGNADAQQQSPTRQDGPPDVLLNVENLEVDRINLTVRNLRAHVSVLAELASLVNLQVGVDARLAEVELEIEGVRAKLVLRAVLDNVRAILRHALDTVAEHPEILRILTRALDELVSGLVADALGTLEDVLGSLEVGDTVDELLRGRLQDARDNLREILDQAEEQAQQAGGATGRGSPSGPTPPSEAGEPPQIMPEEDTK